MGLFSKEENYTERTTGVIVGASAVQVNGSNLPLAEYEVDGKKYKVRVPYNIAVKMEKDSDNKGKIVRANLNLARFQRMKILGQNVTVLYNPNNPKKSKVIEE